MKDKDRKRNVNYVTQAVALNINEEITNVTQSSRSCISDVQAQSSTAIIIIVKDYTAVSVLPRSVFIQSGIPVEK